LEGGRRAAEADVAWYQAFVEVREEEDLFSGGVSEGQGCECVEEAEEWREERSFTATGIRLQEADEEQAEEPSR
jgi:hypothetical protein